MTTKFKTYAGIGSRNIGEHEKSLIAVLANALSDRYIVLSGNAHGADYNFHKNSKGNTIVFCHKQYNKEHLNDFEYKMQIADCLPEAYASVEQFHPVGDTLNQYVKGLMARNYHIIMGYDKIPRSEFVLYVASENIRGEVSGGTGQGARIADHYGIPRFNIRLFLEKGIIKDNTPECIINILTDNQLL